MWLFCATHTALYKNSMLKEKRAHYVTKCIMIFHNLQPSEYIFKSTIAVPIVVNFILFFNTQNYFLHLL